MKNRIAQIIVAASLVLATGCGSLPFIGGGGPIRHPATAQLSIEGQIAVGGRQLVAAMVSGARGIDQLIDAGIVPSAEGVKLLQWLRFGTNEAGRLADALLIIDQARDDASRTSAIASAAAIIKGIQRGLTQAIVPIGSEEGRQRAAAVLQPIADALVAIAVILPTGKDPEPCGLPAFCFEGAEWIQ